MGDDVDVADVGHLVLEVCYGCAARHHFIGQVQRANYDATAREAMGQKIGIFNRLDGAVGLLEEVFVGARFE